MPIIHESFIAKIYIWCLSLTEKKRGKIISFFFFGICCISLEHLKHGTHGDIHPNIAQSGKHWDGWPRLGAGLEDMQEKPSAYKVRNPDSHTRSVCFSDFCQLQLSRNFDIPYRKRFFSFLIPHGQHVRSDLRGKEKKKKQIINLRVQEWKVESGIRCSCQTTLETVALHKSRWFFCRGEQSPCPDAPWVSFGPTRSETLHLTYKLWP